jgi:cytochrome c5
MPGSEPGICGGRASVWCPASANSIKGRSAFMSRLAIVSLALAAIVGATSAVSAYEGNWKRGRVYYRGVCTDCHAKKEPIAPNTYTTSEWTAYLGADQHNKGADTVKQYVSAAYRASIKDGNKVAEKFADVPEAELLEDVKAFVLKGAKDGDAPASCN